PNAVADFARTLVFAGPRVLGPANIGTVVFGVWLVVRSGAWNFSQTWVRIGASLFALAFIIGAAYLGRIGVQLQRAAEGSETVAAPRAATPRLQCRHATRALRFRGPPRKRHRLRRTHLPFSHAAGYRWRGSMALRATTSRRIRSVRRRHHPTHGDGRADAERS